MKTMLFIFMTFMISVASAGEQTLHYHFKGADLDVRLPAQSFDEAIEAAATKCFQFYTSEFKLSRDEKEDLVNHCANPRRSAAQAKAFNY